MWEAQTAVETCYFEPKEAKGSKFELQQVRLNNWNLIVVPCAMQQDFKPMPSVSTNIDTNSTKEHYLGSSQTYVLSFW